MINCRALFLNGPSHSDKSTLAQLLAKNLKEANLLEGEKIVSKENLSQAQWLVATVMTGTLKVCELAHEGKLPIFSFPLRDSDWKIILNLCDHAGVKPVCVTLIPNSESDPKSSFSMLNLESDSDSPEKMLQKIEKLLSEIPAGI